MPRIAPSALAFVLSAAASMLPSAAVAQVRPLSDRMHHLRIDGEREWSEFPPSPDEPALRLAFSGKVNASPQTLQLRQQDVKQQWQVRLNGKPLGALVRDENAMVVYFAVPAESLREGANELVVEQDIRRSASVDDIRVGDIHLHPRPLPQVLQEAALEVEVLDSATGKPLPARITVVNPHGALQTVGAASEGELAVRPGTVFTATGKARVPLPAGQYRVFVGRGFEYSLASAEVVVKPGETVRRSLKLRRETPTAGYVACDTHVHTLTHSGHGDASVRERMITLAAEGIELPVATDHNVQIDHRPFAREAGVAGYFTPVVGNEVTTRVGHFNVFPVAPGAAPPDHRLDDWGSILREIHRTPGIKVAILNHPRDVHSGVRPFAPQHFNSVTGTQLDGWPMRFNAMEVINSGATQSDPLRLFHDWMALLNRGLMITPVGSSDSHDVARHFVGQGRTYVRCDDRDPGNLDVEQAVANFVQGRVMVSYGLLAELRVAGKYGPGELAPVVDEELLVEARVLGPHWVRAARVALYANGRKLREVQLDADSDSNLPLGVKWSGQWKLPRPPHDVHLVAIATGPGIDGLYWKTAKPYQPTSPDWVPQVVGCSGAVWLDVDGDNRRTSARDYAQRVTTAAGGDLPRLIAGLSKYDPSVAAQAAELFQDTHHSLLTADAQRALEQATAEVQQGVRDYLEAFRNSQQARARN